MELAIASLTALMANINRDSAKRPDPFTAADFLPQWIRPPEPLPSEELDPDRLVSVMEGFMAAQKARGKAKLQ